MTNEAGNRSKKRLPYRTTLASRIPDSFLEYGPEETLANRACREEKSNERPIVRFTRCSTGILDTDNFIGGCKPLLDCLRRAGLIDGDTEREIWAQYYQIQLEGSRREEVGTIIEIIYPAP